MRFCRKGKSSRPGPPRLSLTTAARSRSASARGFTLIDALVSISVMAVLISLMLPTLYSAHEATRRVVCASNTRQIGIGMAMFADDHLGLLPKTVYLDARERVNYDDPLAEMLALNLGPPRSVWDGIGHLYGREYLDTYGVFYCPSHRGKHAIHEYTDAFRRLDRPIYGNYQFRGSDGDGNRHLFRMDPATSLVTDGLRTQSDYNHRDGSNVLAAGLNVRWYADHGGALLNLLAIDEDDGGPRRGIEHVWNILDGGD